MYRNCYIAFLDILGFRELMKNKRITEEKMLSIFESFKIPNPTGVINDVIVVNPSVYIMSDSIVVYIDVDKTNAFLSILITCMKIYSNSALNYHIKIRGAIVKGELCVNSKNNIIFGKGLVEAYDLQEKGSKMPRIILTKKNYDEEMKIIKDNNIKRTIQSIVKQDNDLYMKLKFMYPVGSENKILEFQSFLDNELSEYSDFSIRERNLYLKSEIKK